MPFSVFLCQVPDLQSRILKFSGCSITKSSSIWGAVCDSLGRCLLQGIPPVLLASGISWEGGKVKLSTCPTATFYFPATSLSPAINPDWIYIPYTTPRTQLMASDTTNIPLGSSPDNFFPPRTSPAKLPVEPGGSWAVLCHAGISHAYVWFEMRKATKSHVLNNYNLKKKQIIHFFAWLLTGGKAEQSNPINR